VLLAEHQHVVQQVGAVQAGEILVADGLREVEAEDLGAERGVEGADRKMLALLQDSGHGGYRMSREDLRLSAHGKGNNERFRF
jgi:hypothetical protein